MMVRRLCIGISLITLLLPRVTFACATCFGAEGDPQTEGLNMAIITLLGVTYTLFSGMGLAVFLMWRKNQKRLQETAANDALSIEEASTTHG